MFHAKEHLDRDFDWVTIWMIQPMSRNLICVNAQYILASILGRSRNAFLLNSKRKRSRSHPAWGGSVWASTGVHYSVLSHRQWESQVSQTEVGHSRCPLCPRVPRWAVHIKLLLTCEWLSGVKGSHLVKWGMSSGHCPPWFWDVILTYSWIVMGLHSPYLPQDP